MIEPARAAGIMISMRNFFGRSQLKWAVLASLLSVSSAPACLAQQSSGGLARVAMRLAREFSGSKDLRFLHCISRDGLTLTDRSIATSEIRNQKIPNMLDPQAQLEAHRMIEDTVEVGPAEFNQPAYKPTIDRARHFVANSFADPPAWIRTSNLAQDKWRERLLGPAVVGKVAAGTYWYLYLRKEHGVWKIWKFEVDE